MARFGPTKAPGPDSNVQHFSISTATTEQRLHEHGSLSWTMERRSYKHTSKPKPENHLEYKRRGQDSSSQCHEKYLKGTRCGVSATRQIKAKCFTAFSPVFGQTTQLPTLLDLDWGSRNETAEQTMRDSCSSWHKAAYDEVWLIFWPTGSIRLRRCVFKMDRQLSFS